MKILKIIKFKEDLEKSFICIESLCISQKLYNILFTHHLCETMKGLVDEIWNDYHTVKDFNNFEKNNKIFTDILNNISLLQKRNNDSMWRMKEMCLDGKVSSQLNIDFVCDIYDLEQLSIFINKFLQSIVNKEKVHFVSLV